MDVHFANGSPKLIPALRVYDTSQSIVVEKSREYLQHPGSNADCTFLAESNRIYYVQILGQRNTSGPYTLTVTDSVGCAAQSGSKNSGLQTTSAPLASTETPAPA